MLTVTVLIIDHIFSSRPFLQFNINVKFDHNAKNYSETVDI